MAMRPLNDAPLGEERMERVTEKKSRNEREERRSERQDYQLI